MTYKWRHLIGRWIYGPNVLGRYLGFGQIFQKLPQSHSEGSDFLGVHSQGGLSLDLVKRMLGWESQSQFQDGFYLSLLS